MRVELEPGYILHRRDYRDTSLLLDIWTEQYGRVALVARGARGARQRFSGLQPFQRTLFSWTARGDLGTLTAAESQGHYTQLTGRYAISGFYLNELLVLLLHKYDPHGDLFAVYEEALHGLACLKEDAAESQLAQAQLVAEAKILRVFEKRLLEGLGYAIEFAVDAQSGAEIEPDLMYEFDVENGFLPARSAAKETFMGENLLSYATEKFEKPEALRDAKRLMRIALDYHLAGKPLKSRELRIAMERQKQHLNVKEE